MTVSRPGPSPCPPCPINGPQPTNLPMQHPATWRSGYAAACKAVYTGSIPVVASSDHGSLLADWFARPAYARGICPPRVARDTPPETRPGTDVEASADGDGPERVGTVARATCVRESHGRDGAGWVNHLDRQRVCASRQSCGEG